MRKNKINNKKFALIILMIIGLSILSVYLLVEFRLSQNNSELLAAWIYSVLFTALMVLIFSVFIIAFFVRLILKKKNCYGSLVSIIGTITIIMVISTIIIAQEQGKYFHIVNSNWNINLPRNYDEIYHKDSGPSFLGDGERYSIFQYETLKDINSAVEWKNRDNNIKVSVERILKLLEVPKEFYPQFNSNLKYYYYMKEDRSEIYLIFDSDLKMVYIIENIF